MNKEKLELAIELLEDERMVIDLKLPHGDLTKLVRFIAVKSRKKLNDKQGYALIADFFSVTNKTAKILNDPVCYDRQKIFSSNEETKRQIINRIKYLIKKGENKLLNREKRRSFWNPRRALIS